MDKWLLKIVALFNPIFVKQGVDIDHLYAIVNVKLLMDKRRVPMQWQMRKQKESTNQLNRTLIAYCFMGLIMGIGIFAFQSLVISLSFVHGYIILMMAMTLITDFSSVLLDTTDNEIILPKPINGRTLFFARLIHILIYILQFTIAIAIVPIVIVGIKFGVVAGCCMIITSLLSILLSVFFTYFFYLLILRFANEQKVKDIITYFQIFMVIVFMAMGQIFPRILNFSALKNSSTTTHWYYYFFPPFWMASFVEAFQSIKFDTAHIAMIALAIFVPIFLFWGLIKFLAPAFVNNMASINAEESAAKSAIKNAASKNNFSTTITKNIM